MTNIKNTSKTENTDTTSEKKVIAMYRVSTERQDLTRQQEKIRRALTFDGYTEDQIIEIGKKESGVLLTAAEREGIQEMERQPMYLGDNRQSRLGNRRRLGELPRISNLFARHNISRRR